MPPAFLAYFRAVVLSVKMRIVDPRHFGPWSCKALEIVHNSRTLIEWALCPSSQNPESSIIGEVIPHPVSEASTCIVTVGSFNEPGFGVIGKPFFISALEIHQFNSVFADGDSKHGLSHWYFWLCRLFAKETWRYRILNRASPIAGIMAVIFPRRPARFRQVSFDGSRCI